MCILLMYGNRCLQLHRRGVAVIAAASHKPAIDLATARKRAAKRDTQRAFRAVPQLVLTVSRGASRGAEEWAGAPVWQETRGETSYNHCLMHLTPSMWAIASAFIQGSPKRAARRTEKLSKHAFRLKSRGRMVWAKRSAANCEAAAVMRWTLIVHKSAG